MDDCERARAIGTAAAIFGIDAADVRLIRHNENITCRARRPDGDFVLRIHRSADGYATDTLKRDSGVSRRELVTGELAVLTGLAERGMRVQAPVASPEGELAPRAARRRSRDAAALARRRNA